MKNDATTALTMAPALTPISVEPISIVKKRMTTAAKGVLS